MYRKSKTYCEDLENAFEGIVAPEKLFQKSILVTGATGLIGSFLVDLLLYMNCKKNAHIKIYALGRDENRLKRRFISGLDDANLNFIVQDVIGPLRMCEPVDYIIHADGDGYPSAFREHPVEVMTPSLFGTYELLEYARKNGTVRFLYISSGEVYGKMLGKEHAFTEKEVGELDSMDVRSCYPMAKRCAETLCASYYAQYKVQTVVARLSHTYGACTSINDNRATVQFLANAMRGEDIVLHSEGNQMRSYTYVSDCVSAVLTILVNGNSGEAYNVANPMSRVTIAKFAQLLADIAGVKCRKVLPDESERKELTPIEYAVLDSKKLETLGWQGKYEIEAGIKSMYGIK